MLSLTPSVKALVSRRATEAEIKQAATQAGTRFLLDDALDKMRDGLTTPEEILRVIGSGRPGEHEPTNGLTAVRRERPVLP